MPREKYIVAAAGFELVSEPKSGRIQLLPYGEFRASDGRPKDAPAWYLTEENGFDVARTANSSSNPLVVDYEHQTLYKEKNGQPAPAAGWMRWFDFSPQGLFAEVEWTDKAAQQIQSGEYRYISAVFAYDTKGYVRKIYHAALTNTPALDGLDAAAVLNFDFDLQPKTENPEMKEKVQRLLGMPQADDAALTAALSAILAAMPEGVVLSADTFTQTAALSATPDLTQYAPLTVVSELQNQIAALTAERDAEKGNQLIEAALSKGQLLPAQKAWAESVVKQPNGLAFLSDFIASAPQIAALTQSQTETAGVSGSPTQTAALSAEDLATAKMLGMTAAEFQAVKDEANKV